MHVLLMAFGCIWASGFAFDHNIDSLRTNLLRANKIIETTSGSILVISEGVFGMRGDQGILKKKLSN
jgi:glycine C-acetyltransferase